MSFYMDQFVSVFTNFHPLQGTKASQDRGLLKEAVLKMVRVRWLVDFI